MLLLPQQCLRQDNFGHFHRFDCVGKVRTGLCAGLDGVDKLAVLGLKTAINVVLIAAGDLLGIVDHALGIAIGVENTLDFI